jgi:F-type H+-transporting ATPase subunit alpha
MSNTAGGLRLQMAQFRSLAAFAQFGSNLDKATQQQLDRGLRLNELFKQVQYNTLSIEDQIAIIYAGTSGLLDEIPVARVIAWKNDFLRAFSSQFAELRKEVRENRTSKVSDDLKAKLTDAVKTFNATWS